MSAQPPPATLAGAPGLLRNVIASYGVRGMRAFSVLLLTPYLFRKLGVAGFGAWSVLFTVTTIFSLVEYGATVGVTKFVAEYRESGRGREVRDLVAAALGAMTALGVGAMLLSAVLALAGGSLVADADRDAFQAGLLVIGAVQLVRFPGQVYGAVLMGHHRYDLFNLGEGVTLFAFLAGTVAALEVGGGLGWLAGAFAASLVLGSATHLALARRLDRSLPLGPRRAPAGVRSQVTRFGSLALLVDSMDFIAQRMDTLVVAALRGPAGAAPIAAATRMISGVQALILPFVQLILPMVSELDAAGRREELVRRYVLSTRIALQVTLVTAGGLALLASDVVDAWLGAGAPAVTDDIVVVLMIVQVVILTAAPSGKVLLGLGRLRAITMLAVAEGVGNVGLSVILVIAYGPLGAAVATLLTSALLVPARIPLACRATGCSLRRIAASGLWPAVASSLPSLAIIAIVLALLEPGVARLALGLGAGWGVALGIGLLQAGPRRLLRGLRGGGTVPAGPVELSS